MASPMPPHSSGWNTPPVAGETDEYGLQTKFMNLKVHYTFDREAKEKCLARGSQPLQIQTVSLGDSNAIGVVDLRACVHVIAECSPELTSHECDYTIYAIDYSEPDFPLVGQGLLSWVFQSMRPDFGNHQPKMVTGRVTRGLLGVFGGGNRETLEVRLKLSETTRIQRSIAYAPPSVDQQPSRLIEQPLPPHAASEWNSLVQSNHQVVSHHASHSYGGPPPPPMHNGHSPGMAPALPLPQGPPPPLVRQGSFGPSYGQNSPAQEQPRVAPIPVDTQSQSMPSIPAPSSRPSSRASNRPSRRKPPTGRPRGRPRKKQNEGNTSGYEDGTEGEEAAPPKEDEPVKKRAKVTKVDKADANPFVTEPESLRVAASNSSSLRNFRPLAINSDSVTGSHLQEVPRAPTPVPNGRLRAVPGREPSSLKRRESALSQRPVSSFATSETGGFPSPGMDDDRSPDSAAPTPNYPDDSPADIGSSPPVQQATPYMRSSPPPSSPVLPPMRTMARQEHSVSANDVSELFGEGDQSIMEELPPQPGTHKAPKQSVPVQVFQLQDGPSGQDLVHVMTYNTPYPTANTPAPTESSLLPPVRREPSRSQSSSQTTKRKRPNSTSPTLAPTPPPTTDAVERAMSPNLTSTPAQIQAPTPIPLPRPMRAPESIQEPIFVPIPTATSPANAAEAPAPTPAAAPPPPESFAATTPTPELSQLGDVTDDIFNDPIVQLASTFSSREEAPPPIQPPSRSSQPPQSRPQTSKPKYPRKLNRSQSAGPLVLPSTPASDPIGPSTLSQPPAVASDRPSSVGGADMRRPTSMGPLALPIPESRVDAGLSTTTTTNPAAPEESCPPSDCFPPPSSPPAQRSNKNIVKKHAIKQRLEEAISNGEMPPFCSNCGAIETPTWRKIWIQERDGAPERCEYSEKPGKITAVEVLQRDDEGKPTLHRVVKKSLAITDEKTKWQESLLCNPCGIWLTKCKTHRPPDRWDKDASRLGQERRKRGTGRSTSRTKKSRPKDDILLNLTSEAYLPTDALEPMAPSSPKMGEVISLDTDPLPRTESVENQQPDKANGNIESKARSQPGSSHSQGSGTAQSPIDIEFDEMAGSTKRLLFPSPRKDGVPKVLCNVDVNIVQTAEYRPGQQVKGDQENVAIGAVAGLHANVSKLDDLEALFNSPFKERPSTPPPDAAPAPAEAFKTPTRPTPSHRPITRSVSRSLRSARSMLSPNQQALEQTPTKTPRSMLRVPGSSARRRSPRAHQGSFDVFDSPVSRSIVQLLSEGNVLGTGENEVDLSSLPGLGHMEEAFDFGLLSTDHLMPSSPSRTGSTGLTFDYDGVTNSIGDWMDSVMKLK
ncbi:hypothetical protein J3F83DRAFT_265721 [Trichoderma novae-zelandiae]